VCADASARVESAALGLPREVTGFVVPVRTVGVQGDERSYSNLLALEGTGGVDAAAALARRVTNEHRSINRVVAVAYRRDDRPFDALAIQPATLTRERVALLREADARVTKVVRAHGVYDSIWQFPVGMLPLGIAPGRETIVLRPVNSRDGMTAEYARLPEAALREIVSSLATLSRVDAVVYDVTNKPPATIELE
jgi:GMP synthase (glutamine-hydrolysing)